jgi:hypothetical protein
MPDRLKIIAACLIGLLAALFAVVILEMRSAYVHTASIAARRFGVPVLGEITWRYRYRTSASNMERT